MTSTHTRSPARSTGFRPRWSGLSFVLLLLTSAGMASVPGGTDTVLVVRDFYSGHPGVIATAQVIGLLAALMFLPFSVDLERTLPGPPHGGVRRAGRGVAAAAVLTAVPVLALCVVVGAASDDEVHRLAIVSDVVDLPLFAAVAWFAVAVSRRLPHSRTRWATKAVGALAAARAVLLLTTSDLLELTAPLAFVALVVALSIAPRTERSDARRPRTTSTFSAAPPGEGEHALSPTTTKEK